VIRAAWQTGAAEVEVRLGDQASIIIRQAPSTAAENESDSSPVVL
jgi:hypothetical protein